MPTRTPDRSTPPAERLRAWRAHRQGLDGSLAGKSAAQVLEATGWARSVGGASPYLGLHARAGLTREAVDAAVARLEIHELPSVRACTYVAPAGDFALALAAAKASAGEGEMSTARKLGVTDQEIEKLGSAVLAALGKGPLEPEQIRRAVGGKARSLGPEGTKRGLTSTLPLALGLLQREGEIRRVPTNGRLDQQRYRYALWRPQPTRGFRLTAEEVNVELARRYFRWIGPATPAHFQWFSGLGVKAAKQAVAPLGLVPLAEGSDLLLFPEDLAALRDFRTPSKPSVALVGSLDGIVLLRREVRDLLESADLKRKVAAQKGLCEAGGLSDLPSHALLDRGRLIGLWEYDTEQGTIAWMTFAASPKGVAAAVRETERYVREQLGDARSFSLDSPKSRKPRIAGIRRLAG
jgi:hypothetical protein